MGSTLPGPNNPANTTLRHELKKALLQVAELQRQMQKEKEIANKAQQSASKAQIKIRELEYEKDGLWKVLPLF